MPEHFCDKCTNEGLALIGWTAQLCLLLTMAHHDYSSIIRNCQAMLWASRSCTSSRSHVHSSSQDCKHRPETTNRNINNTMDPALCLVLCVCALVCARKHLQITMDGYTSQHTAPETATREAPTGRATGLGADTRGRVKCIVLQLGRNAAI